MATFHRGLSACKGPLFVIYFGFSLFPPCGLRREFSCHLPSIAVRRVATAGLISLSDLLDICRTNSKLSVWCSFIDVS